MYGYYGNYNQVVEKFKVLCLFIIIFIHIIFDGTAKF